MTVDRTFLFSDIEGSTRNWEEHAALMKGALARHDAAMTDAVVGNGGVVVKHTGDGMLAVFDRPADALAAAAAAQRGMAAVEPTIVEPLKVRMGLHCGPADQVGTDFFGATVNRCARLMAAAHGGQIVLSEQLVSAIGDAAERFDLIDLGVHELRDVREPVGVHQLSVGGLATDFPPLKTAGRTHHNLPAATSTFIGRVKSLEAVDATLDNHRVVTVVGPGGCGKTRLAIEAAAARVARHADGAWLVELAEVAPGGGIGAVVAAVLGVQESMDQPIEDVLCARLVHSELLLVLDNCEHVIADVARLASRVLRSCPGVRVLATSRQPLGLPGEALMPIGTLEVPTADEGASEAVQLFIDRAALARPDFHAVGAELAAVARVCRRLDGIPLAIELAAARINVLSVAQLERRLDRRFALLTGPSHRSARQRTLQATVEWSYDLLEPREQRAWAELATFIGGFDLEGAAFVLGIDELDALEVLSSLVDRSIIQSVLEGDGRYRMLETMREFGRERAGDGLDVRRRLRAWALDLAARAEPEHMTDAGPVWHNRLDLEYPNVRLAIESGLEDGAPIDSLQLCADLGLFLWLRGHLSDGRDWSTRSLAAAGEADVGLRARGLLTLGELMFGQVDFASSAPTLEEAARLAMSVDDQPTVGWASTFLSVIHATRGEVDAARAARDESLRVAEGFVIPSVRAGAYYWAGSVSSTLGDEAAAATYLDEALALARTVGSPYTLSRFLPIIARRQFVGGDHETAMATFEEAIELSRAAGDRVGLARTLQLMAEHNIVRGDYDLALARLAEAEPIATRAIDDNTLACRVELTSTTLWRHRGNLIRAQAHLDRAMAWAAGLEGWRMAMDPYLVQAELAIDRGDAPAAAAALARSTPLARQSNYVERLVRSLLLEARVASDAARADASVNEAAALAADLHDPLIDALVAQTRGQLADKNGDHEAAASWFATAVEAADRAGARLIGAECREDLALALHEQDPGDPRVRDFMTQATSARLDAGAPRPAPRDLAVHGIAGADPVEAGARKLAQ